jgi:hypothetical protein
MFLGGRPVRLAAICLCIGFLAACGGSDPTTPEADDQPTTTVQTPSSETSASEAEGDTLKDLLARVGAIRFRGVAKALEERRMAPLKENPEFAALIEEVVVRAAVDVATNKPVGVGVTLVRFKSPLPESLKNGLVQSLEQFPQSETWRVLGTPAYLGGQEGQLWAGFVFPTRDLMVAAQGMDDQRILAVFEQILTVTKD